MNGAEILIEGKIMSLNSQYTSDKVEAGCDEAGRGCLAGPVFAAAVILPKDYTNSVLNDSKKLSEKKRYLLREEIEKEALAFAVASFSPAQIDEINILNASIAAMQKAVSELSIKPELLLIDGNRFKQYEDIPHHCIVKGDALYYSIAAASVLAKTYRDDFMLKIADEFPNYNWKKNKGYPTAEHKAAIEKHGSCIHHRKSFKLVDTQLKLEF